MSNQQDVIDAINAAQEKNRPKNSSGTWWVDLVFEASFMGLGAAVMSATAAPVVIPAALILGTIVIFSTSGLNEAEAKKKHMPDEWLAQVSESPEASRQGLAFLAKHLSKQGFITVGQAEEWVKIEQKIAIKKAEEAEKANRLKAAEFEKSREKATKIESAGAKALLARAQAEIPSLVNLDDISRALKTFGQGTGQALSKIPGVDRAADKLGSLFSGKANGISGREEIQVEQEGGR